jgi:hypothetical protein
MLILDEENLTLEQAERIRQKVEARKAKQEIQEAEAEAETGEEAREYQKKRLYQVRLKSKGYQSQSEKTKPSEPYDK